MKTFLFALACLAAVTCQGEPPIVTTVIVKGYVTNSVGGIDWMYATNVVAIPNGQAARVSMSLVPEGRAQFVKSGVSWTARLGHTVQGPAEFIVWAYGDEPSVVTLDRWTVRKVK